MSLIPNVNRKDAKMQEMHVIATGKVQGIGFRAKVKKLADDLKLTGYVRNLSNGDVEIRIQGAPDKLNRLLEQIKKTFSSHIEDIQVTSKNLSTLYEEFRITLI